MIWVAVSGVDNCTQIISARMVQLAPLCLLAIQRSNSNFCARLRLAMRNRPRCGSRIFSASNYRGYSQNKSQFNRVVTEDEDLFVNEPVHLN